MVGGGGGGSDLSSPGIADTRLLWLLLGLRSREREGSSDGRATVPAVLQYRGYYSRDGGGGAVGALGTLAAGLRPRPAREKGFPSNLLLD